MYELTITVRTDTDPHGLLWQIKNDIHEHVHVLGITYQLISQRPIDDLHHGGNTELETSQQEVTQTKA